MNLFILEKLQQAKKFEKRNCNLWSKKMEKLDAFSLKYFFNFNLYIR